MDGEERGSSLGHQRQVVEEAYGVSVALDREWAVEGRWKAERHFDLVGCHVLREPAAGIPAVRGRQRTAKVTLEGDLHVRRL